MHATEVAGDARAAELLSMYEQIERRHMFPFWARGDSAHDDISQLTNGPRPVPHRWSYRDDIQPLLPVGAPDLHREHRPPLADPHQRAWRRATVSTLYTAYRQNDPNELMPPHARPAPCASA